MRNRKFLAVLAGLALVFGFAGTANSTPTPTAKPVRTASGIIGGASAYNASAMAYRDALGHAARGWTWWERFEPQSWTYEDGDYDVARIHVYTGYCADRRIMNPVTRQYTAWGANVRGPYDFPIAPKTMGVDTMVQVRAWPAYQGC